MIYVVISQEDRLVYAEKVYDSLEKAKNFVNSLQNEREIVLEWALINKIWFKSYKTPGSRVVFSIYERNLE